MNKSNIMILLLIATVILSFSAVSAADTDDFTDLAISQDESATLEVDDSLDETLSVGETEILADPVDGNNFTSLQSKISQDGVTELTLDKDYTRVSEDSDIVIDKDFTINGANTYSINADNLGGIFKVNSGKTLTLIGVTLKNGNAEKGGAVYVENGAALNTDHVKFVENTATYKGGAVYSEGSVKVNHTEFDNNNVTYAAGTSDDGYGGAAIYNLDGNLDVDLSVFRNNLKDYTYGTAGDDGDKFDGAITTSGTVTITNSNFTGNKGRWGSSITMTGLGDKEDGSITIDNCNFTDNLGYDGGAVYINHGNFSIQNCWFENNKAIGVGSGGMTASGGAIVIHDKKGKITGSTFKGNRVEQPSSTPMGGAIGLQSASVEIDNCNFENNFAADRGGAIMAKTDCNINITNSNFTDNSVNIAQGGAVMIEECNDILIDNVRFEGSNVTGASGGALYLRINEGSSAQITNTKFINNEASMNGGAIFINAPNADVIISNVEFKENKAGGNGGSILAHMGNTNITGCNFTDNSAVDGGAVYIRASTTATKIEDSIFEGNVATGIGNAIYSVAALELNNNSINKNSEDIYNEGIITSTINATVLNNGTVYAELGQVVKLNATITDGNGNLINDPYFNFTIDGVSFCEAVFNPNTNIYEAEYICNDVDKHIVGITYPITENLNVKIGIIDVARIETVLTVNVENTEYGQNATVEVTLKDINGNDLNGTVTVTINNIPYSIPVIMGVGSINNVSGLAAKDNYLANATVEAFGNYTEANATDLFNVSQASSSVEISNVVNATYPGDVTIGYGIENGTLYNVVVIKDGVVLRDVNIVEDIPGTLTVSGLGAGVYNITVLANGDENHTGSNASALFEVYMAGSSVVISNVVNATYPGNATVAYTVVNGTLSNVIITKDGVVLRDVNIVEDIPGTLTVSGLGAGVYNITLLNNGDENYTGSNASALFEVYIAGSSVVIDSITNVTYPTPVEIRYTVANMTYVNITVVDKDNKPVPYEVISQMGGVGLIQIKDVAAGVYNITIANVGNDNVTGSSDSALFNVSQAVTVISVSAVGATYPGNVTVTVSANVGGEYVVKVGGKEIPVTLVAGEAKEVNVTGLTANETGYIINVTYTSGNENYTDAFNDTETVKLMKATITITLETEGILACGNDYNVTFVLPEDVDGKINVTLNDTYAQSYGKYGNKYVIPEFASNAGDFKFAVNLTDDTNYNDAYGSLVVYISKYDSPVDINVTQPVAGDNATVNVTVPEEAGGNVTVTLSNGTNYTAPVDENGTAIVSVPNLPAGDNEVTVTYTPEDSDYASKTIPTTIHVKKLIIKADNMTRGYNSGMDYQAKLLDEDGNPVANRTLTFAVNGKEYNATTDADGIAKINPVLAVGQYNVTVSSLGADNTTGVVNIVKRTTTKDLVMDYIDGSQYKVRVIGDDGKPVGEGVEIEMTVNGVTYKVKTDKNGYASLPIKLKPKTYTITSTYKGDNSTNKITVKPTLKLNVKKLIKIKKSAKKLVLKASLKWSNGKAIKYKKVVFKFKGKKYKAKTNKKGIAKVTIKKKVIKKLKKGKKYKYSVKYVNEYAYGKVKVKK